MTENAAQYVVEVVGDAAGEDADLLQAPRLPQACFQTCALRFGGMPLDGANEGIERRVQEHKFACIRNATGPTDRVETERNANAIIIDVRGASPSSKAELEAGRFVRSLRHAADAG
ncbi:MAG: hypothetical protein ABUL53_06475, partial [Bradyrhizobium guangdongense]